MPTASEKKPGKAPEKKQDKVDMRSASTHFAHAGDVSLAYQSFGAEKNPTVLLVMGFGAQLVHWPDSFVQNLVDAGYRVIRMDNRDIGCSQRLDWLGVPNTIVRALLQRIGIRLKPPYSLDDMADDCAGLLDTLGIDKAHIIGASMGGMISQLVALNHGDRLLSMTSIMSTTNDDDLPPAAQDVISQLIKPPPLTREAGILASMETWKVIGSQTKPMPEKQLRELVALSWDRGISPGGVARQLAAILSAPGRSARLASLSVPTLVVHGEQDALVPPSHGKATADAIPNATFKSYKDMAHSLEEEIIAEIMPDILEHLKANKS